MEGKSLRKGERDVFTAGDNERMYYWREEVIVWDRSTWKHHPEALGPDPPPVPPSVIRGLKAINENDPRVQDNPFVNWEESIFDDSKFKKGDPMRPGKLHLNFGQEDRAYGYWAKEMIQHQEAVREYKINNPDTKLTGRTHLIKIKSFKVRLIFPSLPDLYD